MQSGGSKFFIQSFNWTCSHIVVFLQLGWRNGVKAGTLAKTWSSKVKHQYAESKEGQQMFNWVGLFRSAPQGWLFFLYDVQHWPILSSHLFTLHICEFLRVNCCSRDGDGDCRSYIYTE